MSTVTKLFKSNQTQAVRLPKAAAFPEGVTEVEIVTVGASRVISPVGQRWDSYFERKTKLSDDVLTDRAQGEFEQREPL